MTRFILASHSPRRKELLKSIISDFDVESPDNEICISNRAFRYKLVEKTAEEKCKSVLIKQKEPAVIISADTVVVYNKRILGKPGNFYEAFSMLKLLSGNTHKVVTAVCVINGKNGLKCIRSETSSVTFNKFNDKDIENYILKFLPYDKAGSYGIQELEKSYIKEIKGDYNNIVGLPVDLLKKMITEITSDLI